jgi:Na+:H+ antiporter
MVQTGNTAPDILEITFLILKILGLFVVLLVGAVILVPRILHVERLWCSEGSVEGITTAAFFGAAGIAAFKRISCKRSFGLLGCISKNWNHTIAECSGLFNNVTR